MIFQEHSTRQELSLQLRSDLIEFCHSRGIRADCIIDWCELDHHPATPHLVVGKRTGLPMPQGELGLIRYYGVTTKGIPLAIQTTILGYDSEAGLEIYTNGQVGLANNTQFGISDTRPHGAPCSTIADTMIGTHGTPCSTVADAMIKSRL